MGNRDKTFVGVCGNKTDGKCPDATDNREKAKESTLTGEMSLGC